MGEKLYSEIVRNKSNKGFGVFERIAGFKTQHPLKYLLRERYRPTKLPDGQNLTVSFISYFHCFASLAKTGFCFSF